MSVIMFAGVGIAVAVAIVVLMAAAWWQCRVPVMDLNPLLSRNKDLRENEPPL